MATFSWRDLASPELLAKTDPVVWDLLDAFETPEARETCRRLQEIIEQSQWQQEQAAEAELVKSLNAGERRALQFIRQALKRGQSPSVREISQALGRRSSRSG